MDVHYDGEKYRFVLDKEKELKLHRLVLELEGKMLRRGEIHPMGKGILEFVNGVDGGTAKAKLEESEGSQTLYVMVTHTLADRMEKTGYFAASIQGSSKRLVIMTK